VRLSQCAPLLALTVGTPGAVLGPPPPHAVVAVLTILTGRGAPRPPPAGVLARSRAMARIVESFSCAIIFDSRRACGVAVSCNRT
jgi:hypothetical protein